MCIQDVKYLEIDFKSSEGIFCGFLISWTVHFRCIIPDKCYNYIHTQSPNVAGWHTLWRKEQRCPPAHFCVYGICIITNNGAFIKYRTKTPQTIIHLIYHCVFTKIFPPNSPYWRRYTFLRVRLRNRRFLPHPQKLVAATDGVYEFIYKFSTSHP